MSTRVNLKQRGGRGDGPPAAVSPIIGKRILFLLRGFFGVYGFLFIYFSRLWTHINDQPWMRSLSGKAVFFQPFSQFRTLPDPIDFLLFVLEAEQCGELSKNSVEIDLLGVWQESQSGGKWEVLS